MLSSDKVGALVITDEGCEYSPLTDEPSELMLTLGSLLGTLTVDMVVVLVITVLTSERREGLPTTSVGGR